jgi:Flp pilus assembly protein TadG
MMPWVFFLFVGALDFGFYSYALISTQNAARVAALYTAQCNGTAADQGAACQRAAQEMATMPNSSAFVAGCSSGPLVVTVTAFTDSEGLSASRVRVAYETLPLMPIPGLLPGQLTIARTAEMRVFGD